MGGQPVRGIHPHVRSRPAHNNTIQALQQMCTEDFVLCTVMMILCSNADPDIKGVENKQKNVFVNIQSFLLNIRFFYFNV